MRTPPRPLVSRREFIQVSAGVAAVAATVPLSALAGAPDILPLHKVVYDERFGPCRLFANEAKSCGADVHAIRGEVHDLWYDDLYYRWKSSPVAIAGMTTYVPMFRLAILARDARMRVIYRAHHEMENATQGGGHEVFGPHVALTRQSALRGPDTEWSRGAARIVTSWPSRALSVKGSESNIALADQSAINGDTLLTWLISTV